MRSDAPKPADSDLPARVGRYRIVGRLATGGMAEILIAALDGAEGFTRPVVIKRVLPHLAALPEFREMFIDEARIVSGLRHANVVSMLELGDDGSSLYLVMDYLEGESLDVVVKTLQKSGARLPPTLAAYIVAEAAAGLHAAHELTSADGAPQHVVHRDATPQNIFIGYDGSVKLIDFGIAKAVDRATRTQTGVVKGKFAYMAPEQIEGTNIDRRVDVFALGAVLWELLENERLFSRSNQLATMKAIASAQVPRLSESLPAAAALDLIVARALARQVEERYPTTADLRRDLIRAISVMGRYTLPQEELARTMRNTFADRIRAKQEMLRLMSTGAKVAAVLDSREHGDEEPDEGLESDTELAPARAREPERSRRSMLVGVLVTAAAFLVASVVWWSSRPPSSTASSDGAAPPVGDTSPAASPEPTSTAHASAPAPPPASSHISIHIETRPPGAAVSVDGRGRGVTPLDLQLPRADRPVSIELSAQGFVTTTEQLVPDVDQRLRLTLERVPRRRRRPPPTSEPPPEPPPEPVPTPEAAPTEG